MPLNPTQLSRGDIRKAATIGSTVLGAGETINLQMASAVSRVYSILGLTRFSAHVGGVPWGNAAVEVERSMNGLVFSSFMPKVTLNNAKSEIYNTDADGTLFLRFRVSTDDPGASSNAPIILYPFRP